MMIPDPGPVIAVTTAARSAVEAALQRRDLTARVRERLEMVKADAFDHYLGAIAA